VNHSQILKTIEKLAADIEMVGYSSQSRQALTTLLSSTPGSGGGVLNQWFNSEADPIKKRHLQDVTGIIVRLYSKRDGAIAEAMRLPGYCKLIRTGNVKLKGRQKAEHDVTKWVRQHWHKYGYNKRETVRRYILVNGGTLNQLYEINLKNDLKKNPLLKPKKSS